MNYTVEIDNKMHAMGEYDEQGHIKLNLKKGDVVNTVIHEKLHANHPNMTEKEVYKKSDEIESKMSLREMAHELLEADARSKQKVIKDFCYPETITEDNSKIISQTIT